MFAAHIYLSNDTPMLIGSKQTITATAS